MHCYSRIRRQASCIIHMHQASKTQDSMPSTYLSPLSAAFLHPSSAPPCTSTPKRPRAIERTRRKKRIALHASDRFHLPTSVQYNAHFFSYIED